MTSSTSSCYYELEGNAYQSLLVSTKGVDTPGVCWRRSEISIALGKYAIATAPVSRCRQWEHILGEIPSRNNLDCGSLWSLTYPRLPIV